MAKSIFYELIRWRDFPRFSSSLSTQLLAEQEKKLPKLFVYFWKNKYLWAIFVEFVTFCRLDATKTTNASRVLCEFIQTHSKHSLDKIYILFLFMHVLIARNEWKRDVTCRLRKFHCAKKTNIPQMKMSFFLKKSWCYSNLLFYWLRKCFLFFNRTDAWL